MADGWVPSHGQHLPSRVGCKSARVHDKVPGLKEVTGAVHKLARLNEHVPTLAEVMKLSKMTAITRFSITKFANMMKLRTSWCLGVKASQDGNEPNSQRSPLQRVTGGPTSAVPAHIPGRASVIH